jgi:assimilatory nitrate reductase catalytic subunit
MASTLGVERTTTHCPYCALQCGMLLSPHADGWEVSGDSRFPVNRGGLCLKGASSAALLNHPDRLTTPLVRSADGRLEPATWDAALGYIASWTREIQHQRGRDAVAVFGGGSLTNEKAYLLGKFARVALGTSNVDYNGRFCMSSAATAATKALGIDRGLPFPLSDIPHADVILLAGSNLAETMPPVMRYFEEQQINGGMLIVVDPRRSATALCATRHLQLSPGSDAALANGLLHVLVRDDLIDDAFIRRRTEDFEDVRRTVAAYPPERVERLTGVAESQLVEAARLLGRAQRPMILTGRGSEQQAQGVHNTLAYINIALALGSVGKPFSGYGTITGQGNGQGGREHGQKADQLPGYRRVDDPLAREHVARVWGVPPSAIPGPGRSAFELLDSIGPPDGIRGLLVFGSNPAVSAPDSLRIERRLRALDLLVVADFFVSETAALAHVVLPTAQWAEEDGTMTNLEGRVIRRRRAADPPHGVRTDVEVLCELAAVLGKRRYFSFAGPRDVFDELCRATQGGPADYSGITYDRLDSEDGVFWPCPAATHPGTPRLFAESFPTTCGHARFHAIAHQPPAEERDVDHPLYLTTGRVLAHYQSGTQTRRVAKLEETTPEPVAEIHPATARRLRLAEDDHIVITTRRGTAVFPVKITPTIREDTVFVPFHWAGSRSANRLTNPVLDPISRMPEFKVCAARVTKAAPPATDD